MTLQKTDSVYLRWSHGERPEEKEVEELNEWLEKKWDVHIRVRFEDSPDSMTIFFERYE